jgi:hypothetical protein
MAILEQNAASQGQLLPVGPRIIGKGVLHLVERLLDQLIFGQC